MPTAEEVSEWVKQACKKAYLEQGQDVVRQHFAEYSANAALVLVRVACSLLDTHVKRLADDLVKQGGFTERMYRVRLESLKVQKDTERSKSYYGKNLKHY